MPELVTISYQALLLDTPPQSLLDDIVKAFGNSQDALGAIIISDLPSEYPLLRERLLRQSAAFAKLSEERKDKYVRPDNYYMFGWSHGKEIMNGKPDVLKGSYYANPITPQEPISSELKEKYSIYYGHNVWPDPDDEGLEHFERDFKALGEFIWRAGVLVARACETFVSSQMHSAASSSNSVASLVQSSRANKARLLHYFPADPSSERSDSQEKAADDACGTHVDHSLLTGLCSAMYLSSTGEIVPPPDPTAGLYIQPRSSTHPPTKISIPSDCLAFQTGEALALMTGGKLAATLHWVSAGRGGSGDKRDGNAGVSRETFAFFLQPDVESVIGPDGETFGEFSKRILEEHYGEGS